MQHDFSCRAVANLCPHGVEWDFSAARDPTSELVFVTLEISVPMRDATNGSAAVAPRVPMNSQGVSQPDGLMTADVATSSVATALRDEPRSDVRASLRNASSASS